MLPNETPEICRLCLVKEHVNINIFENDTRQLFHKISSCLPINVSVTVQNALLFILDH